jgi:hypothetical protein
MKKIQIKMKKLNLLFIVGLVAVSTTFTSCRLVDFTIISSKNVTLDVKKDAPRVSAWGWTVKDALDKAIEKAGPGYDALIDGVVSQGIFAGFTVKGTLIKISETKK